MVIWNYCIMLNIGFAKKSSSFKKYTVYTHQHQ